MTQDPYGAGRGPLSAPPAGAAEPGAWSPQPGWAPPLAGPGAFPPAPQALGFGTEPAPGRTNTMAVLGLVFAFVMPVLGAVFSAIGLRQTKQRGEGGRGLAVAGLVVSVVVFVVAVALVAVLGAGLTMAADRAQPLSGPGAAAPGAAGGVPAGGGQGVVDACHVILPAMTQVEAEVGADHGTDPVDTRITALQQQITAAAAPSGDPVFIQHAQALAADFGRLVSVARTGGDFGTLLTDIEQDGAAIGRDCGSAGWTP